jgi:hypothetical protein
LLGNEHTNINFKDATIFPLLFYWFEEGIFLVRADVDYRKYLYAQVIEVNHRPILAVIQSLSTLLPDKNEGAIKTETPQFLSSPTFMNGLNILSSRDSILLKLCRAGDTMIISVPAKAAADITLTKYKPPQIPLRHSSKKNYWYHYDSSADFIYFNYSKCTEDPAYPFSEFQKDFFRDVAQKNPGKLIIDLRDNGGGNERILFPFIEELYSSGLNRPNKVYVLIGRKTFSSALLNVLDIEDKIKITTIGESTSGSINHFGEVQFFQLPESGLKVSYSTKHFIRNKEMDGPVNPDIVIPETLSDFTNGTDSTLNYAIAQHL